MTSSVLLALFLHYFTPHGEFPEPPADPQPVVQEVGNLTVDTIGSNTVVSVPPGAQRVPVLTLRLKASCSGDIRVSSITVQRRGLGDTDDIKGVYLMSGGSRMSSIRQISQRAGFVQLRTRSLIVPACETKVVGVYANFSNEADIAGEHRFVLKDPDGIAAGGAIVNVRQRAREGVRRTVGVALGTVSVEYLQLFRRITYGLGRMVARLSLEADGVDDHLINAIILTNEGSARDNHLRNLYLVAGNRVSKRVPLMDGKRVRLIFNPPLLLEKNDQRILTLRADVRASRSRTIRFVVDEPSDIEAKVVRGRL